MKEWVLYVMTWASRLSGYPFPDELPAVQLESESWFSHRVCKDHIPCAVFGMYEDHDVVFLRDDLTDSAGDHIAVHEFVHYLQHHSGRSTCTPASIRTCGSRRRFAYRLVSWRRSRAGSRNA
jgi:hypothetical protein